MPSDASQITCRFVARASDIGFPPPPVALRLQLVKTPDVWSLFVQTVPPGPVALAVQWLEPFSPRRLEFGVNNVLRADFEPPPHEWLRSFHDVEVDSILLQDDGRATLSVTGGRRAVARVAALVEERGHALDVRHVSPAHKPARLLTLPQEEAIRAAILHGYYDIPRPINLHALAAKLGVTSASLSERLRRAEGRIIRDFAARGGAGRSEPDPEHATPTSKPEVRTTIRDDVPREP